jgi:hypothetical protein
MEAIHSSETSIQTRTTRRHIQENGILHSHRRETLKCYYGNNVAINYVKLKRRLLSLTGRFSFLQSDALSFLPRVVLNTCRKFPRNPQRRVLPGSLSEAPNPISALIRYACCEIILLPVSLQWRRNCRYRRANISSLRVGLQDVRF